MAIKLLKSIIERAEELGISEDETFQEIVIRNAKKITEEVKSLANKGESQVDNNLVHFLKEITLTLERVKPLNGDDLRDDVHLDLSQLLDNLKGLYEARIIGSNTCDYFSERIEKLFNNIDKEVNMDYVRSRWQKIVTDFRKVKELKISEKDLK